MLEEMFPNFQPSEALMFSHGVIVPTPHAAPRRATAAPAAMQREGLARLLTPVIYVASVFAVVAAGASVVWHPSLADSFRPGSVGVLLFTIPMFYAMVWIAAVAGVAAGFTALGTVIGFALFGRMSWRGVYVVGQVNGLLAGLLLLDAANIGAGPDMVHLAPIVPLPVGIALAPVLSVVLILTYHYLVRPHAEAEAA
jgi:hypothetical protein